MWTDKQLSLKVYSSNLIHLYISLTQFILNLYEINSKVYNECIVYKSYDYSHQVSQVFHHFKHDLFLKWCLK